MDQNNVTHVTVPKLLTIKEVKGIYRCCEKTIYNMIKAGMLKPHKLGTLVRFRADELPILNKTA
jgi:excisionase family DNA binding protein